MKKIIANINFIHELDSTMASGVGVAGLKTKFTTTMEMAKRIWRILPRWEFVVSLVRYLHPRNDLLITKDYFRCVRRLEANDEITWWRFKILYVCLSVCLANNITLLVCPGLGTALRLILSDNVLLLNLPSAYNVFNISFVSIPIIFYRLMYFMPTNKVVHSMAEDLVFDREDARRLPPSYKTLKRDICLFLHVNNFFYKVTFVVSTIVALLCQVRLNQINVEVQLDGFGYLWAQLNWFLFATSFYALIHSSNITLSNLIIFNRLELLRLRKLVGVYESRPMKNRTASMITKNYFRHLCGHLRVIHQMGQVYNMVSLFICGFCVPTTAYNCILVMFDRLPPTYKHSGYMTIVGEWSALLVMHVLFAVYPRLVHHNVQRVGKVIIVGRRYHLHDRWKLAAHYEHFHVIDSQRYGFNYGGVGLVNVVSFLRIVKTFTELIMFSYNLIL